MNRWRWLLRPKWFLLSVLAAATIVWVFWPIPIYQPRVGTFLMVEQRSGKSHFLGMVKIIWHSSPSRSKARLAELRNLASSSRAADDGRWWMSDGLGSEQLCFTRGNLLVKISPARSDQEPTPGDAKWLSQFEKIARDTDASIRAGSVGGREVTIRRVPRGLVWLFPEGMNRAVIAGWWNEFRKILGL